MIETINRLSKLFQLQPTSTQTDRHMHRKKDRYLSSGIEVADGVSFKVIFILPAQHSCDDDDNECYYGDGGQHRSDNPKVIRRVLDHS